MACRGIEQWTFPGLLFAFLDLGVACFLLCASTLAYVVSKFLGLLGLKLPCPCDGIPDSNICVQRILFDCPSEIISNLQSSVKYKFPFDSVSEKDVKYGRDLTKWRNDEHLEYDGGASSSSYPELGLGDKLGDDKNFEFWTRRHNLRCRSKLAARTDDRDMPIATLFRRSDSDGNEYSEIRVLEDALKEEHAALVALQLELEKERSAAATAAEEAMAMILRLQEEKASIEMEANQFRRMVEEKSVYEAEEMNILREIVMRSERENHCLEKEVEVYRQMIFGNECPHGDWQDIAVSQVERPSLYLGENSMMVQELDESAGDAGEVTVLDISYGKDSPIPPLGEGVNPSNEGNAYWRRSSGEHQRQFFPREDKSDEDVQEKEIVAIDENISVQQGGEAGMSMKSDPQRLNSDKETGQTDDTSSREGSASKTVEISNETQSNTSGNCDDMEKQRADANRRSKVLSSFEIDSEPSFHEVHVIDDAMKKHSEVIVDTSKSSTHCIPMPTPTLRGSRSCSEMTTVMPPRTHSRDKVSLSGISRNSMTAADSERYRIGNEVGELFKRLRVVQEGREKLNFPVGAEGKRKQLENTE